MWVVSNLQPLTTAASRLPVQPQRLCPTQRLLFQPQTCLTTASVQELWWATRMCNIRELTIASQVQLLWPPSMFMSLMVRYRVEWWQLWHFLKWNQHYWSLQRWHSQKIYDVWIYPSWKVRYYNIDCSPKLVLFLQAEVCIAENSNILDILRMSALQGQIILNPF